jgi:hypothetical protein
MTNEKLSNKQSVSGASAYEEQSNKEITVKKVDHEIWSIECTIDELELDLSRATEKITPSDGQGTRSLTVRKYYQQAKDLAKWIPIARPVPEFVVNVKDLSPEVIRELEPRIDDLPTLGYILKEAVGRIFENLDHTYYHLSIARNLRVRMEP